VWLKSVPETWKVFDGKRIFESCREAARSTDEQLAASQKFGVVPQSLMMELNDAKVMLALKGTSSFRHVEKDDYVISLRSFEGGIEYSAYTGCVSPAYTVLRPTKPIVVGFYRHLFKSRPYISALQATTDSLRDGKAINYEQFGAIPLILPPLSEQIQIAKFLDHETAKIDRLIEKQEELIRLLKEKRQAVISHAVTKGLNPHAPLKPSGIPWLAQIPAHWSVTPLKRLAKLTTGITPPTDNQANYSESEEYPWVRPEDLDEDGKPTTATKFLSRKGWDYIRPITKDASLICCIGTIGKIGFVDRSVSTNQQITAAEFANCARFYFFALVAARVALETTSTGNVIRILNTDRLGNIPFAAPPADEGEKIAKYIDTDISKFQMLTEDAQRVVTLLQERRTALISAAVTGKIDVRHWQQLPAEIAH
jgi:type I restriction enzyme S subunit